MNQLVRGVITLAMTAAFIYGFIVTLVGTEAFVTLFGSVLTWWFVSRTNQQQRAGDGASPPTTNGGANAPKSPTP